MSSNFLFQSFQYRETELRRAAEQHRMVKEAHDAAKAAKAARTESVSGDRREGGATRSHFRGVRRARRASSPSAC